MIRELEVRKEDLLERSEAVRAVCSEFGEEQAELLSDISVVGGVVQYSVWLKLVENTCKQLEAGVQQNRREDAVQFYLAIRDIEAELQPSSCRHLKQYVSNTAVFWLQTLETKLVSELEQGLTSLGWPFIQLESSRNLEVTANSMSILELQNIVKNLILIQDGRTTEKDANRKDDMKVTLPMKVLLKPLRKRFKFHFLGNKSTNNPAKPEWYITQLVLWAQLHKELPCISVVGILKSLNHPFCNASFN